MVNDFVEPNINEELGKDLTLDEGIKGVAFFKKIGEKDCTHGYDILEPLTKEELGQLISSDDPETTLKEKDWVRCFCIEAIDPEYKYVIDEGRVRILFFEGKNSPTHVYLDGEPQMNLACKYAYFAIYIQAHLENGGTLQTVYKDFPG